MVRVLKGFFLIIKKNFCKSIRPINKTLMTFLGDWQLASVSKDNTFRLWMVDSTIRKLSGVVMEPGEAAAFADRTILASGETKLQPPSRQLSAPSRFSPPAANGVGNRPESGTGAGSGSGNEKIKLIEMDLASLRKLQDKSLTIDKVFIFRKTFFIHCGITLVPS